MIKTSSFVLIFATAVSWLIYLFPKETIRPGALLEKHRQLEESCSNCHDTFFGPSSAKCKQCHRPEKIGLYTVNGKSLAQEKKQLLFHANLTGNSCTSCHKEHQGSFAASRTIQFSHERLGIRDGSNCVDCHKKPKDSVHRQAGQNCVQCHKTTNWVSSEFNHNANFRFDKDHPADCATCHPGGNYKEYTCYGCHEHSQRKIDREHIKEGIRNYENCVECHPSGNEHDIRKPEGKENHKFEFRKDKNRKRKKKLSDHSRKSRGHSNKKHHKKDGHKKDDD